MNEPSITRTLGFFALSCRVEASILASAERVWVLLTDAQNYPRWNTTVTSIEGRIAEGERLRVSVPGTNRAFTPRVSGIVPHQRMTWTGGFGPIFKGVRRFELKQGSSGSTDFAMEERFSGLMLPFIKGVLPDFGPIFQRFASGSPAI